MVGDAVMDIEIRAKAPEACSAAEIDSFEELVGLSGSVARESLRQHVLRAANLEFLWRRGRLSGTAALKLPSSTYRARIETGSNT